LTFERYNEWQAGREQDSWTDKGEVGRYRGVGPDGEPDVSQQDSEADPRRKEDPSKRPPRAVRAQTTVARRPNANFTPASPSTPLHVEASSGNRGANFLAARPRMTKALNRYR
jgi:hypothetical protein